MKYKATIGLETHVQLKTFTKIFCGCRRDPSSPPNTNVCPVCLGYPGAMPVLNEEAVRLTVKTGMMIGSRINAVSKFDRKSYFYPDMPKNYQISQFDQPFCSGGTISIDVDGKQRCVAVNRIHLEEDVAKNTHYANSSGIDFNRAGTPLMEIVTEPDIFSPEEAFAYLHVLKQILLYGDISEGNLEEGNIRCDVNCSVRREDQEGLGTKTEIKNMNTFKGILRALKYEIPRQIKVLEEGGQIQQETRSWDDAAGVTTAMRSKEYAHDYRYFPEPDLLPVTLTNEQIETWRAELPELPQQRRARLTEEYGLPTYDADQLVAEKEIADFFEETARLSDNPKSISNWIMTDVMHVLSEQDGGINSLKLTPAALAALVKLIDEKVISSTGAHKVFEILIAQGGDPRQIVTEQGLAQVSDTSALDGFISQVLEENPQAIAEFRSGKKQAIQFLVGQVMRLSRGKANPQMVREMFEKEMK